MGSVRTDKVKVKIRQARQSELDTVAALHVAAYDEYRSSLPAEAWEYYRHDLMNVRGRLGASRLLVAEVDGQLAGAVTLYLDDTPEKRRMWPRGWAGIRLLAVLPAFRKQGTGRKLMEACLRLCRKKGISTVGLHTTEMMAAARRLYERMGFIRDPKHDFHPAPGVVVMAYAMEL
jgi:GNAT superfamily N-acetyltransferase